MRPLRTVKYFESTTIYCNCGFSVVMEDITHDISLSEAVGRIHCIRRVLACTVNVPPPTSWIDYLPCSNFCRVVPLELRFRHTVVYRKSIRPRLYLYVIQTKHSPSGA